MSASLLICLNRWVVQTSATVNDFVSGTYVMNNAAGIRRYPYSTSAYVVGVFVGICLTVE